jgi:hypothetical protein
VSLEEASLALSARLLPSRLVRVRARARARARAGARARARARAGARVRARDRDRDRDRDRVQAVGAPPALEPPARSVVRVGGEQLDLFPRSSHLRLVTQEDDKALALVHAGRRALLVQHEDIALRALPRREERA